nr:glycosyltransferase family 2 protein [Wielerella bovis]
MTPTIGRPELARAIESVQAQNYPCTHYVFVDGEPYHAAAREILQHYPQVKAVYLPVNTGANNWFNSHILAAAPFIAQEDIICFLDDDNTYRADHIASIVETFAQNDVDYVYALRNFINPKGKLICRDDHISLGDWCSKFYQQDVQTNVVVQGQQYSITSNGFHQFLIDVNCFAFKRKIAQEVAHIWCITGHGNDVVMTHYLRTHDKRSATTGRYTVNYLFDYTRQTSFYASDCYHAFAQMFGTEAAYDITDNWLRQLNQNHIDQYGGRFWAKE